MFVTLYSVRVGLDYFEASINRIGVVRNWFLWYAQSLITSIIGTYCTITYF
jgi:L-rhamnose isomerase